MRKIYIPKIKKAGIIVFVVGILFSIIPSAFVIGQVVTTYNTAGTYTFTVPSGVTSIQVEAWGAGGGGASAGGGGGGYASSVFSATGGNQYTVKVGAGGSAGNDGEKSSASFGSNLVSAGGGSGANGNSQPGSGGNGITGTVLYQGGNGGTATGGGNYSGGRGGGSAFNSANGNNGNAAPDNTTGGSGGTGTGNGGNGASRTGTISATSGSTPGGGGGGRASNGNGSAPGADGQVIITYNVPAGYCGGNAIAVTSNNSVNGGSNALGAPDNNPATFDANGDQLVLDLINNGNLLNSGGTVGLIWAKSSGTFSRQLTIAVSSNNVTWTTVPGGNVAPTNTSYQTYNFTLPAATRYIRLTVPAAANGSIYLDAVSYLTPCTPPVSITTGSITPSSFCV